MATTQYLNEKSPRPRSAFRSLVIAIIIGMLISTAVMAVLIGSALLGNSPAMNVLLELTMPSFNVLARLSPPIGNLYGQPGGGIEVFLAAAWVQIGLIAAGVVGLLRAVLVGRG